jgi:predicted amidohydrolase YtcJ
MTSDSPYADVVFRGGHIVTVDESFSTCEAIAVRDGRIVAGGSSADMAAVTDGRTRQVDLGGRTVLPGFIDLHGHIGLFGLEKHLVDLAGATSVADVCARVAEAAAATPAGQPILTMPIGDGPYFFGGAAVLAEGRFPDRWELDAAAPDHPVYITAPTNRVPNSAVFNSRALALAGLSATQVPAGPPNRVRITPEAYWLDGIEIVRDPATGEPTGELRSMQPIYNPSEYFARITAFAPPPSYEIVKEGIRRLAPDFLAWGTTSLLENHLTGLDEIRAYAELDLPLRIHYTFEVDADKSLDEVATMLRTLGFAAGPGFGNDRLGIVGISIGLDGPHYHGTAYLGEPYQGPYGELVNPGPLTDPDRYRTIMRMIADSGFRIHTEAAGRASIGLALSALAEIDADLPIAQRRTILEHCEFPTQEQIAECRRLGVVPTTTTNFLWGKGADVYLERLGREYAENAIPFRWWLDAGVPVCNETDWGPHDPLFTIWQSIARQAGATGEVVGAHQRVTREEAIRMMTSSCAYALGREDEIGSLRVGAFADFVVLDGDPLSCPEDEIKDISVDTTVIAGVVVHQRDGRPGLNEDAA